MGGFRLPAVLIIVACGTTAAAQPVQGDVKAVGFPTAGGYVIRFGQWFPILANLTVQGSQVFSGELRAEALDLDGDRVAFRNTQVTVTPEAGVKRAWCYAVANALGELPPTLDVVAAEGALIAKLPLPPCGMIQNDDLLVLDISYPKVDKLDLLKTPNWDPGQRMEGLRDFYRNVVVAHLPAADLPDRWFGLEAVDVVVWDRPNLDPKVISEAQVIALIEWVRNGGQLLVGVGTSWSAIRKHKSLADIMPLQGEGPVVEVSKLNFLDRIGLPGWTKREFPSPVPVTTAEPTPDAVRTQGDLGPRNETISLITLRLIGSGRVVATAASLRDLTTNVPVDQDKVFGALVDLNRFTAEYKKGQTGMWQSAQLPVRLYDDFVKPVAFGTATAVRGLTAFLFVAAYIVLATLASWWWLQRRKLTHLSWTMFSSIAVAGSALSLATVGALRGFSRGVQSLCVIDLEAGASTARGTCLFGYKSPIRQHVELALPGEGNFLRPLSRGAASEFYVTPARYAAVPARARLDDVLMRATLKQVAGFWHGDLEGTLRADLVASRGPDRKTAGRLTPASWIANELNVDLEGGYLLFIDPRQAKVRAADLTTLWDRPKSIPVAPPAANILTVRLPRIPVGQRIDNLGAAQYQIVDRQRQRNARVEERKFGDGLDLITLWEEQQGWAGNGVFGSLGTGLAPPVRATLLASTRNYYLSSRSNDPESPDRPVTADGMPNLEISHWLLGSDEGSAVLLCWADRPGPAHLHVNNELRKAYEGLTVYRVRVSIRYEGTPPSVGSEP